MNKCKVFKGKTSGQKKLMSLRRAIFLSIVLCWLLPTTAIITIMTTVSTNNRIAQIEDVVKSSGSSAFSLMLAQLDASLDASRDASYISIVSDSYQRYLSNGDEQALSDSVTLFLAQQYGNDEHFLCSMIFFFDDLDRVFYNCSRSSYSNYSIYMANVHTSAITRSATLDTRITFFKYGPHVYMMRNLMRENFTPYGMVIMELDADSILASMDSIAWSYDLSVKLGDIYIGGEDDTRKHIPKPGEPVWQFSYSNMEHAYVCDYSRLGGSTVAYAAAIDASDILDSRSSLILLICVIASALFPLLFFIIVVVQQNINRPIRQLIKAYHHIEDGELGYQAPHTAHMRELDYLITSFNDMSSRLSDQFERLYREELILRDAKIMALQSQINPHFLNNTLEIINWEARFAGDTKVSKMIESLSILLEAAMDRSKRPFIHLSDELVYINAYLYILSERFGKRLTVVRDIDENLLDVMVPRLVLQPIVENAVEHGIHPRKNGTVIMRIYRESDYLKISVINDGKMTDEDIKKVKYILTYEPKPGEERAVRLGIRNVNERIKILYGQDCGLDIHPLPDGRTETLLSMHLLTSEMATNLTSGENH